MKRRSLPPFADCVNTWWKSLTLPQQSDVLSWSTKNPAPRDWGGTQTEWAYLNMPTPEGW